MAYCKKNLPRKSLDIPFCLSHATPVLLGTVNLHSNYEVLKTATLFYGNLPIGHYGHLTQWGFLEPELGVSLAWQKLWEKRWQHPEFAWSI